MSSINRLQDDTNHLIAVSKTGFNESTHNKNDDSQEVTETRLEEISSETPYDERDQPDETRSYKVEDMRAHFEDMMKINKSFSDENSGRCDSIVEDMKAHFEKISKINKVIAAKKRESAVEDKKARFEKMSKINKAIAAERSESAVEDKKAHFEKIIKTNKGNSAGKSGRHDSIVDELKARFNKTNKISKDISEEKNERIDLQDKETIVANGNKKNNDMELIASSSNHSKKMNAHNNTLSMNDAATNKKKNEEQMNNLFAEMGSILAKREVLHDLSNELPSDENVSRTEVTKTNEGKVTEQSKKETEDISTIDHESLNVTSDTADETSKCPTDDSGSDKTVFEIDLESTNKIEAAAGVPMKSEQTSDRRLSSKKKKCGKCACLGVAAIIVVLSVGVGSLSYFMIFTTSQSRGQVSPPISTDYPSESPTGKQPSELYSTVPTSSITNNAPTIFPESMKKSILPTRNPTKKPSVGPSPHPTYNPSYLSVTEIPTRTPTVDFSDPSWKETFNPTVDLTMTPTNTPTKNPSVTPSSHPTYKPSYHQSDQPTVLSSRSPTVTTTDSPTQQPTPPLLTKVPTYEPSQLTSPDPTTTRPTPIPSYRLIQIGTPIAGVASNEFFGKSLSLSHNGTKLCIGSPFHDGPSGDRSGLVVIYERTTTTTTTTTTANDNNDNTALSSWRQTSPNIYGRAANEWVGWSVSQSSDGSWIAINGALNSPTPYVKVFGVTDDNVDNRWMPRGTPIEGGGGGGGDGSSSADKGFGLSVSLSRDGSYLAVGSRYRARSYRYDEVSDSWLQVGSDVEESLVAYVAMAGDGGRMVVGCPGDDSEFSNAGRVRMFRIDYVNDEVRQMGRSIYGNAPNDNFGHSVSLSYDGETVALGSYAANYVKVFVYDDDVSLWKQSGDDIVGGSLDNKFGSSLSLSQRGDRLVVGSPLYDNDRGRAVVYQIDYDDKQWIQIGDPILGEAENDQEAYTVSMSEEGDYVAVAALKADKNGLEDNGSVRVFKIV